MINGSRDYKDHMERSKSFDRNQMRPEQTDDRRGANDFSGKYYAQSFALSDTNPLKRLEAETGPSQSYKTVENNRFDLPPPQSFKSRIEGLLPDRLKS